MAQYFDHMRDLDGHYVELLDPHMPLVAFKDRAVAHNDKIYELLRARGAPTRCYVISVSNDLDGQEVDLREALGGVVGELDNTFISCIAGRLAYLEGEALNERYLLERSQ